MKNLFEKIREISNTRKINKWLIVAIVILFFVFIMVYPSPEADKKTANQKWQAMVAKSADDNAKEREKENKEQENKKKEQKTKCITAVEQEVNKYISGAQYPWSDNDWYITSTTDDSGTEFWTIRATISIKNVVEKKPIRVVITIIDDNHYKAHYVAVGDVVYYNNGFAEE